MYYKEVDVEDANKPSCMHRYSSKASLFFISPSMTKTSLTYLALLSFLSHLPILTAYILNCFNDNGFYSNSSAYRTNLNTLLSNLTSDPEIDYGFYNSSYGQRPSRVYAFGLCKGDVKPDSCRSCLNNAAKLLPNLCPNQKGAFFYDDLCMLRYSSGSIFGMYQKPGFSICIPNPNNETDSNMYDALDGLLASLRNRAARGDSRRKVAAAKASTQVNTIYGVVQCTPDLSEQACRNCLLKAVSEIPNCSKNKTGGRVIKLSCNIRYEHYNFYDSDVKNNEFKYCVF